MDPTIKLVDKMIPADNTNSAIDPSRLERQRERWFMVGIWMLTIVFDNELCLMYILSSAYVYECI